jgi:hypothetical protein
MILNKKGGEGVALPKPAMALDPFTRHFVEEDGCLTCLVKHFDPRPPELRETFGNEDAG